MSSIEKEIRLKINDNDIERIKNVTDSYKGRTRLIDITCGKYEFDSLSKLGYIGRIRCNGNSYKIEIKNYQNKDGSITIPKALQKYFGKDRIVKKEK